MSKTWDFIKNVYHGKTIGRIFINWNIFDHCQKISGSIIDLAGGKYASYYRYLPQVPILRTNYTKEDGVDMAVDITKPLPFKDHAFDTAFLINALYIVPNQLALMKEIRRILKPGGVVYLTSPFIMSEIPEPHDYTRLTKEGLEKLFLEAGFSSFQVYRYGNRFTASANIMHGAYLLNTVRLIAYTWSMFLDKVWPAKQPVPIGYFCIVRS